MVQTHSPFHFSTNITGCDSVYPKLYNMSDRQRRACLLQQISQTLSVHHFTVLMSLMDRIMRTHPPCSEALHSSASSQRSPAPSQL